MKVATNSHAHCPASAPRCGYNGIFLVWSIQVHPLRRLLVDWAWSGLGNRHMTSHHMIPHMAGLSRDLLYIGFLDPIHSPKQVSDLACTPPWVHLHGVNLPVLLLIGLHLSQGPRVPTSVTSCIWGAWIISEQKHWSTSLTWSLHDGQVLVLILKHSVKLMSPLEK